MGDRSTAETPTADGAWFARGRASAGARQFHLPLRAKILIDSIPDAGAVERFGPEESPNACLLCHSDKDAQWLKGQLGGWEQAVGPQAQTRGLGFRLAKFAQETP